MPVTNWSTMITNVALPNTYHQLAVFRGTGWLATSRMTPPICNRASSQVPSPLSQRGIPTPSGRCGQRGQHAAAHPQVAAPDRPLILEQAARRWAGGTRAVVVVNPAVAGAHKKSRLREPADRTAEMGAVDRKHLE